MRYVAVLVALLLVVSGGGVQAQGVCLTRDEAIVVIAHKVDVEHGGRLDKALIWQIAERESGLSHCDKRGRVKVSPTGDRGLLQFNPAGVFGNCLVNRWCRVPSMIDDPYLQIDVMLNYADVYGDLCPWNPAGNYLPGCGYGTTVRSGAARRALASSVDDGAGQGDTPPDGDGPSRADEVRDR